MPRRRAMEANLLEDHLIFIALHLEAMGTGVIGRSLRRHIRIRVLSGKLPKKEIILLLEDK